MCGLSPQQSSELGWFDLVQFTLRIDDDNEAAKKQIRDMRNDSSRNRAPEMNTRL
jgi:hypothetical protein